MSQIPISSAPSENINVPPITSWSNQPYDNSHMYSHQFPGQQFPPLQNWLYQQNMSFFPPSQFPAVQNVQLPPTQSETRPVRAKFEDDEDNDENEPPKKSPRLSHDTKYLDLDTNQQSNYNVFISPGPPTSFTQSTPKMPPVYTGANFNTPTPQLGLLSGYNTMFSPQLSYHQLQNPYTNTAYSSHLLGSQCFSPDSMGMHGSSSGVDSCLTGSGSGHSTTNSSGSTDLQSEDGKKTFHVPGRLALLNSNQKYPISIGEINRRLGAPENINTSLLGAMLRRAKNKDGGKALRIELQQHGINMPVGRRRSLENTSFTALCEAEAMNLARDLSQVLQQYFPTKLVLIEVALTIQRSFMQPSSLAQDFFQLLENIENSDGDADQQANYITDLLLLIMDAICTVLERDRSLIDMGLEMPQAGVQPLPAELQKGLYDFNLVTHNFGVKAILAAYRSMSSQPTDKLKPNTSDLGSSCASN